MWLSPNLRDALIYSFFVDFHKHLVRKLLERRLWIKKSKLPGARLGLFSRKAIEKGACIVEYRGRLERWANVKHTDGYNPYLLRVNALWVINALPYRKTPGRYANDARGPSRMEGVDNNAEYRLEGRRCFIYAKRNIARGEEILVSYGHEFWSLVKRIARRNKT